MGAEKTVMTQGRTLSFIISSMGCGGAQRVASQVINHWAERGDTVQLITLSGEEIPFFFPLHPSVEVVKLGISSHSSNPLQGVVSNISRVMAIRKAVKKRRPDFIVSFMDTTNVITLLASIGLGVPVIVSEHTNPDAHQLGRFWDTLRQWTYHKASAVTVLTKATAESFLPAIRDRIHVLPNPVLKPENGSVPTDMSTPSFLCVGRISEVKRYHLAIQSFARIADRIPEWGLTFVGDGPLLPSLEKLVEDLGLSGRIRFLGAKPNPNPYYKSAGVLVMTSLYEGFPGVMTEALACRLPVVSFDCPTGPREILEATSGGILVPNGDVEQLSKAMLSLASNPKQRKELGQKGKKVLDLYSIEEIMKQWDVIFSSIDLPRDGGDTD